MVDAALEATLRIGLVLLWVVGAVMITMVMRGLVRRLRRTTPPQTDRAGLPYGCLACNAEAVRSAMNAMRINPEAFQLCPPTRRKWPDVTPPCELCGAQFLIDQSKILKRKESS